MARIERESGHAVLTTLFAFALAFAGLVVIWMGG
jgi:hypothetical protein